MNSEEYLKQRLEDQIEWYDKKSQWNKKRFIWLSTLVLIFASTIPLLSGISNLDGIYWRLSIGLLGALIAVFTGVLSIFKFYENWIAYRTTSETLKYEKYLYLTKTSPYDVDNSFSVFVSHVENILSKENKNWAQYIKTIPEKLQGNV